MSTKEQILTLLADRGSEGLTGFEAVTALGLKRVTESTRRKQLIESGLVGMTERKRNGKSVYVLSCYLTDRDKFYPLRLKRDRAKRVGRVLPLTSEYVRTFVELEGCTLHEDYVNCRTPLEYTCAKGHDCTSSWSNFRRYPGACVACAPTKQPRYIPDREYAKWRRVISRRIRGSLKNYWLRGGLEKAGHTYDLVGYTPSQLVEHIMSHRNWPLVKDREWNIDHIYPIKAFIDFGVTDLSVINGLDNLRPLSKSENISKNDSYDREEFLAWLATKGIVPA